MTGSTTTRRSRILTVATVAAAAFALAGCSLLGNVLGGDGVVAGEGEVTDAFEIMVGDCLNDAAAEAEVSAVPRVPCSEPHDSEVYESALMDAVEFPGYDAIDDFAGAACATAFGEFIGLDYDSSAIYTTWYSPTVESWEQQGDREILCIVYEVDASGEPIQTTGSLAGVAR